MLAASMTSFEGQHDIVEEVELELHGIVYIVSVLQHGDELLVVKIEDRETLDTWHGEFAAKYVEDITSKTGSFKKFSVFVRMLQSAVLQQSDSVFVDLLTCQDLEMLKAKKAAAAAGSDAAGGPAQQQQQARALPGSLSSKRYLILTYASEFDRVHYPLPLLADVQPNPARLKEVISSLRQQLAAVQAGLPPPQLLQPQGGQQLLMAGRHQHKNGRGMEQAAGADVALLASRLEVAQAELEGERAAHRREMRKKIREVQELQEELSRSRDIARELRLRLKALEADLEAARSSSMAAAPAVRPGPGRGGGRGPAAADRYSYGNSSYLSGSSKFPSRPGQQYTGSRNSSRGSSPASSRGQSPSYTRPWAQNVTPPRPPRPSSAPPKQRFDPTEYIRQKREREQQCMGASRRSSSAGRGSGSPAPSTRSRGGDTSGASTPRSALSHASSFNGSSRGDRALQGGGPMRSSSTGRAAGPRPSQGPGAGRLNSTGGSRGGSPYHHSSSSDMGRPGSATRQLQQRPGSSASSRDQLGAVYGVGAAWGGSRSSSRQRSDRIPDRDTLASGRDGPGSASPGRALQGVRDKLDAYYAAQQQRRTYAGAVRTPQAVPAVLTAKASSGVTASSPRQQQQHMLSSPVKPAAASTGVFKDASSEIADIDQRLHALQNFLKAAKSSVSAA